MNPLQGIKNINTSRPNIYLIIDNYKNQMIEQMKWVKDQSNFNNQRSIKLYLFKKIRLNI